MRIAGWQRTIHLVTRGKPRAGYTSIEWYNKELLASIRLVPPTIRRRGLTKEWFIDANMMIRPSYRRPPIYVKTKKQALKIIMAHMRWYSKHRLPQIRKRKK